MANTKVQAEQLEAAQTNITSVGTLSALTVSGAANLTLTTAAQTNITSVGTLTGLQVDGGVTVNGAHINIDSGMSFQWGDSHERIEQSDGKIEFFTGNSEKMTLSGGNLGIGTTSPADNLHLNESGATSSFIRFSNSNVSNGWSLGAHSGGRFQLTQNGVADRLIVDSSGKVGIGTTTNAAGSAMAYPLTIDAGDASGNILEAHRTANSALLMYMSATGIGYFDVTGTSPTFKFRTGGTDRVLIDSSGKVGIGEATPSDYYADTLVVKGADEGGITIAVADTYGYRSLLAFADDDSGDARFAGYVAYDHGNNSMQFGTSSSERMRITSAGYLKLSGAGGSFNSVTDTYHEIISNTAGYQLGILEHKGSGATNQYGLDFVLNGDPANTTNWLMRGGGPSTKRFFVYSNGDLKNTNNSYTGISDLKLKENIEDASSQWSDIKALRIRKYSLKEEHSVRPTQIGVIAQEVEAAGMGGLVFETPDTTQSEDGPITETGESTKNLKYSVLYMKAVGALQEAIERIEALETEVAKIKGA